MLAVAMMTASVSAQKTAVTANKAGDNWYIGINAGVGYSHEQVRLRRYKVRLHEGCIS